MIYSICLFLYWLKLFEHSKYITIYKIGYLWNIDSFSNFKTLKICYFSKLKNFRSSIILKILKIEKFLEFSVGSFSDFSNFNFLEF